MVFTAKPARCLCYLSYFWLSFLDSLEMFLCIAQGLLRFCDLRLSIPPKEHWCLLTAPNVDV